MSRTKVRLEPGSKRASRRLALKIAARTSIRSLGRSALIAVMVALPVAGLTAIAIGYDSSRNPTAQERIATELGQTEAQLLVVSPPSPSLRQVPTSHSYEDRTGPPAGEYRDPADVLPAGTRILTLTTGQVTASTATGRATFSFREGPSWSEFFAGKYDVVEGRAPANDREVMVTASLLERLGVRVGGSIQLQTPAPSPVTVVGILDDQTLPASEQWFFAREGVLSGTEEPQPWESTFYLADTELDWEAVKDLNDQGITAVSRSVLLDPPPAGEGPEGLNGNTFLSIFAVVAVGAGFAAFEVILLAGAAFTVTARQQQRTLATIASVGAPRRLLFRMLSANGVVLGAIGGAVGVGVGVAGAAVFTWATANGSSTQYYGFHIPWLALVGFVGFAVLIGWIASLLPARNASRFDIVAALRGARKPPRLSKRKPVVGLALLIIGVAVTIVGGVLLLQVLTEAGRTMEFGRPLIWVPIAMLVAGPILAQLGLALCGPLLLLVIARLMRRGGIGGRLASRDAARNPSRAVPALAAIMTTVFVAVFAMCMVSASQETARANYQYSQALGQISVPLKYVDWDRASGEYSIVRYEDRAAIEAAIERAVEVDELRTIASVPDPINFEQSRDEPASEDSVGVAVPIVPAANLCPASPHSPEFREEMNDPASPHYVADWDDWRCETGYVTMGSPTGGHLLVGDAEDLALVLNREPSPEALRTLSTGGAVSLYPHYVDDGTFVIEWWPAAEASMLRYYGGQAGSALRSESLDAVLDLPENPIYFGVFVSEETADHLGLEYEDSMILASTVEPPDTAQLDALREAVASLPGNPGGVYPQIETGPQEFATLMAWALLALSALVAIASAAVAIGLARFDGRQDAATLSSLGAGRLLRRNFAFWQGLIIAGSGAALGAGTGLVPAFALSANPDTPFVPPWLQIGLTVVALPLLIAFGSWLTAGRNRVAARRMSIA